MHTDVSIIINGHREGLLAVPSIRSAALARACAERAGITVETIYVLDLPDLDTVEQFRAAAGDDATLIEVQSGDPALARNAGVEVASGKWIAILDADDLWTENWIRDAFTCAESFNKEAVWHPELNLLFGDVEKIFFHPDMEDERFDLATLAVTNYWTALCFVQRKVLLGIPYRAADYSKQIGIEDWGWNIEAIANGLMHKVVPGTLHAIRKKANGLSRLAAETNARPRLSLLFRNILRSRTMVVESARSG
jgi:glycosyltransferase involved in cell wall biosynthesis